MSIDCRHQNHLMLLKCRILSFTLLLLNPDISGGNPREHISNKFSIWFLCTLKVENYWFKYLLCSLCLVHCNSLAQDSWNLRFSLCPWQNLMLLKWRAIDFWLLWNPIMLMWQKILQMLLRLFTEIWKSCPEQNIQKGSFLRSRGFTLFYHWFLWRWY